jgi:glycosyltransferase involved in cell wall biosynthesis
MKSEPLVSVIIPFYNNISDTLRSINSVLRQSYKNYEILLIDDASTDSVSKLLDFISSCNNIYYFKNSVNMGPSYSRNVGIYNSKGDFVAFLDSDDTLLEHKISIQLKYMIKNNIQFSHTSYFQFNNFSKTQKIINSGKYNYSFPFVAFHCLIATPTVMVKKDLLSKFHFDNSKRVGEDGLMWISLSRFVNLTGIDQPLTIVNVNKKTTSLNKSNILLALKQNSEELKKYNPLYSLLLKLYIILCSLTRRY